MVGIFKAGYGHYFGTASIENLQNGHTSGVCTKDQGMVLILDGYSEIDAHVMCNICYLIVLRHLIRSRVETNRIFLIRK